MTLRPHARELSGDAAGTAPYGFVRIAGELVEDRKEQKIIQLMIHHWRSGLGFTDIARRLNSQKVKPRMAAQWDGGTVRKLVLRHQSKGMNP